jgi:hypothetical protein
MSGTQLTIAGEKMNKHCGLGDAEHITGIRPRELSRFNLCLSRLSLNRSLLPAILQWHIRSRIETQIGKIGTDPLGL